MWWLAGDDPGRVDSFERMPVLEYYMALDRKMAESESALKQQRKQPKRR